MAKVPEELTSGDKKFIVRALRAYKAVSVRNETKARANDDEALADAHKASADNCDMISRKL